MQQLLNLLRQHNATLTIFETTTGGLICSEFVRVPGSSAFLYGGIVGYHNEIKEILFERKPDGVVSAEFAAGAARMVAKIPNARDLSIGISESGIAPPKREGSRSTKPVGVSFVGVAVLYKSKGIDTTQATRIECAPETDRNGYMEEVTAKAIEFAEKVCEEMSGEW